MKMLSKSILASAVLATSVLSALGAYASDNDDVIRLPEVRQSDRRDDDRDERKDDRKDDRRDERDSRRDDRKDDRKVEGRDRADRKDERRERRRNLYSCNISFHATGRSIYIGVGFTDVYGKGTLSCYDYRNGQTEDRAIKVTARGPGAGLGVTGLVISGGATGIGITDGPESLFGHYGLLRANAAVGIGAAGGVGIKVSNGAATLDVSVQAESGLGAGVDLLWVNIEPEKKDEKREEKAPEKLVEKSVEKTEIAKPAPANVGAPSVNAVPVKVVYVTDNQPVQVVDSQGKLLQVIYLKRKN